MRTGQSVSCCQQKDRVLDEFRDVFYTMQDIDVAGWVRSLQLRGIALPNNIKDEIFLIIGERRF